MTINILESAKQKLELFNVTHSNKTSCSFVIQADIKEQIYNELLSVIFSEKSNASIEGSAVAIAKQFEMGFKIGLKSSKLTCVSNNIN